MPKDCNAFDFETITDVIFNLKYTARDGGAPFAGIARSAATLPGPQSQSGITPATPGAGPEGARRQGEQDTFLVGWLLVGCGRQIRGSSQELETKGQ